MNNKTYLVLTSEKIEDIFRDLEENIFIKFPYISNPFTEKRVEIAIKETLNSKKQELLKSIK